MRMVIRVRDLKSKPEGEGCGPNSSGPLLLFPALLQPIRFFSYTLSVGLHALCVCLAILIGGLVSPAEPPAVEYRVKATPKSHGEFRGTKQTVLSRVEVLTDEQAAALEAKEAKKAERAAKKAAKAAGQSNPSAA